MRWTPIVLDVAIMIVMWAAVLRLTARRRAQMLPNSLPHKVRGYRYQSAAMISAAIGVTSFVSWLVTDTVGPDWLHAVSAPAALLFIAAAAVSAGYAGWLKVT